MICLKKIPYYYLPDQHMLNYFLLYNITIRQWVKAIIVSPYSIQPQNGLKRQSKSFLKIKLGAISRISGIPPPHYYKRGARLPSSSLV
ncbi:hypothetical protein D3C80_866920 [compost metagenome]